MTQLPQDPIPQITERLSRRLVNFKLSDSVISALADRMLIDGLSIGRFDPCIYGVCVDYFPTAFRDWTICPLSSALPSERSFPTGSSAGASTSGSCSMSTSSRARPGA